MYQNCKEKNMVSREKWTILSDGKGKSIDWLSNVTRSICGQRQGESVFHARRRQTCVSACFAAHVPQRTAASFNIQRLVAGLGFQSHIASSMPVVSRVEYPLICCRVNWSDITA